MDALATAFLAAVLVVAGPVGPAAASILGQGGAAGRAGDAAEAVSKLPAGLMIGAGTSALQTEGAWNASGKAESQADFLFHSGKLGFPDSHDVAADSYHRFREDVAKAKELGLQVFRLSLSWSRILPTGDAAQPNTEGVDFYRQFLQEIRDNGMEPFVTLYHFDHPQILQKQFFGWENIIMTDKFNEFADFAYKTFGDLVKYWVTFNEPNFYCMYFNALFLMAGEAQPQDLDLQRCLHHFVLGHMKAYRTYRNKYFASQQGMVGATAVIFLGSPASTAEEDLIAAEAYNEAHAGQVLHPLVFGDHSPVMRRFAKTKPLIEYSAEEKKLLKDSTDFFGINVYSGAVVKYTTEPPSNNGSFGPIFSDILADMNFIDVQGLAMNFDKVEPQVLHDTVMWVWGRYGKPIFITESGYSGGKAADGPRGLNDHHRAVYHSAFLRTLVNTIDKYKVDVRAYIAWSLIDCYEWSAGYSRPFGLVHVDYESGSLNRTLKDSAAFWQQLARERAVPFVAASAPRAGPPAPLLALLAAVLVLARPLRAV